MSTVITPFQGTDPFSTATFNNRISQINTGFSYISNPNLLDNWYFGDPVDQRGGYVVPPGKNYYDGSGGIVGTLSTYTTVSEVNTSSTNDYNKIVLNEATYFVRKTDCVRGYTGTGYGIDRWFAVSPGTLVTVQSGYVRIAPPSGNYFGWMNYFEADSLLGQTVTFSALCRYTGSGGVIFPYITAYIGDNQYADSAQINQTTWQCISFTFTFSADKPSDGRFGFDVVAMQNFGVDIKAAKLELGSQQTLAHQDADGNWVLNEIPDYGEQLARCQRYQRKIFISMLNAMYVWNQMIQFSLNDVLNGMRATPALTLFGKQMDTATPLTDGLMGVIPGGNGDTGWIISAGTTYSLLVENNSIIIKAIIPESKFTVTPNSGLNYALHCGEGVYIFADANL